MKNQYIGWELPKKEGLGQFVGLTGGLAKMRDVVFLKGVWMLKIYKDILRYFCYLIMVNQDSQPLVPPVPKITVI